MNNLTSTSIPVKGDRQYVMTIKALAAKHNKSVAAMVRHALDSAYGNELASIEAAFAASDDANNPHIVHASTIGDPAHVNG